MRSFSIGTAAALLAFGVACAQTPMNNGNQTATPHSGAPAGSMDAPATSSAMPGMPARGASANSAVNTSSANAAMPATGANSFTRGEAGRRIAANGFTNVSALKKDKNGVWRGHAQKDGQAVGVWLDYRGNVGQD